MAAHHLGFSRRKVKFLEQFTGHHVRALKLSDKLQSNDTLYVWGDIPVGTAVCGEATLIRVEDGFIRSAGLGVTFAPPLSWTFDHRGLHHWGHQVTDLEELIKGCAHETLLLDRAAKLRLRLLREAVTKYNLSPEPFLMPQRTSGRKRILVIGQVADDAALRGITTPIRTNMDLLGAVCERHPQAEIVYRPHPDVVVGARDGHDEQCRNMAHRVITTGSMEQLLPHVDEVHLMNSLTGFEAMLRHVPVVCYAQPFYAGWGLTTDVYPVARRSHASMNQLIAAALIRYPRYVDPRTGDSIEVEAALDLLTVMRKVPQRRRPWSALKQRLVARYARLADGWRLRLNADIRRRHV